MAKLKSSLKKKEFRQYKHQAKCRRCKDIYVVNHILENTHGYCYDCLDILKQEYKKV